MQEFKLNLGGTKDIIIQVPEEHEIVREEAFAVAIVKLQEIIADGVYPVEVTKRLWPCIFCDVKYKDQAKLMAHMRSAEHKEKNKGIYNLADKHMKKPVEKKEIKAE